MKLTVAPVQIFVASALTVTEAGELAVTFIVIALDVAGEPETHGALEVITQVITSPLANPLTV